MAISFQYASDLHLEFPENRYYLDRYPLKKKADILLLAGDIFYMKPGLKSDPIINEKFGQFEKVYIVPGNHEFYQHSRDIKTLLPSFEWKLNESVSYLFNKSIIVDDEVKLIFTTLWSRLTHGFLVESRMNDFRQSTFDGELLTSDHYNHLHGQCMDFLASELEKPFEGKVIVVSHHAPYPAKWISETFKGDVSEAYHTDLTNFIKSHRIDYWIHGHNHFNNHPVEVENTTVVTNQLGYTFHDQGQDFDSGRILKC